MLLLSMIRDQHCARTLECLQEKTNIPFEQHLDNSCWNATFSQQFWRSSPPCPASLSSQFINWLHELMFVYELGSLCSLDCPGAHCIEIHLPLPLSLGLKALTTTPSYKLIFDSLRHVMTTMACCSCTAHWSSVFTSWYISETQWGEKCGALGDTSVPWFLTFLLEPFNILHVVVTPTI